jgi:hypothetical protein
MGLNETRCGNVNRIQVAQDMDQCQSHSIKTAHLQDMKDVVNSLNQVEMIIERSKYPKINYNATIHIIQTVTKYQPAGKGTQTSNKKTSGLTE